MNSPLDTTKRLIALALNQGSGFEESRTAALAAIKLIDQHDLLRGKKITSTRLPGEPRGSTSELSGDEMRVIAMRRVSQCIASLVRKSVLGSFPFITAKELVQQSLDSKEIYATHQNRLLTAIRKVLQDKTKHGVLNKVGKGEYQLARGL